MNPPFSNLLPQVLPAQAGATYVGDDTCSTCHTKEHEGYAKTAHNRKVDPRTAISTRPAHSGRVITLDCETCHKQR